VERGLAVSSPVAQDGRPDKRLYRITPTGEASLRSWLGSGEPVFRTTRDGLLVKLFFGGLGELDGLRAQLLERKREAEQKLAELEEIDRNLDREEDFFPYLTLLQGLEITRAMIRWVDDALRELDHHEAGTRSRARS
jgi:PadR family transcriptional regulator, regulatory protein AphA